jgi:pimeloyl-ACP methyl ester carboxylesterase
MLTRKLRYGVALYSLENNFGRNRNLIILHGMLGSSENFRSLAMGAPISTYFNTHVLDLRNHGN